MRHHREAISPQIEGVTLEGREEKGEAVQKPCVGFSFGIITILIRSRIAVNH
jgi:hypothetical protein